AVITWDGRLDNRADLISELRDSLTVNSTDVAIVAAAYEKWGANCLGKLIGDWALSIWNPRERSVLLAKDPIGTKHLYYSFDDKQITWSTILDPLVLFAGKTFEICEEYIAGWLAIPVFPAAHLTPYVGIHIVPPSSSVILRPGKHIVNKYWDFRPDKRIRYRTDAEYEEHFRTVFAEAVRRRLRSDRPVLAELSGGMDSSSIVCVADAIIARGSAETPSLDTISWDDYSNPSLLDEHAYFTKVEEKRGRIGCHIDLGPLRDFSLQESFEFEFENGRFAATPSSNSELSGQLKQYAAYMKSQGHRVTLSGIGGDEATGGRVPTPTQELQDLLARARFPTLARQLKAWAVKMNKKQLSLLREAVRGFFPHIDVPNTAPWFSSGFVRRNWGALCGYPTRVKLFGPLPSFQDNIGTLDANRRFFACCGSQSELLREVRYPYFDRNFLEFMYAIPREEIVGVGTRRFLMKRAVAGIVPSELINRRPKPLDWQEPNKDSSMTLPCLLATGQQMVGSSIGIIDSNRLLEALQKARRNEEVSSDSLKRTLFLESWLRHLTIRRVLTNSMATQKQSHSSAIEAKELSASAQPKGSASCAHESQRERR
ncbi:MAG: asparagine synthase-related protein, partial [Terriglobales bacterium]